MAMNESKSTTLAEIQDRIGAFVADRQWQDVHTLKNLCIDVAVEAGELLQIVQWRSDSELEELSPEDMSRIQDEVADVLIGCLKICNVVGIDPQTSTLAKIRQDEEKYPAKR